MRKILFNLTVFIFVSVNFSNAQTRVPNDGASPIYYKNGNVGIGYSAPAYKLDVYGGITTRNASGDDGFRVLPRFSIVDGSSGFNAFRLMATNASTNWKGNIGLMSSTTWTGDGTTKTWLGLATKNKYGIALVSGHKNNTMSQINSRLMIGYDSWSPDFTKADVLSVNGNTLIEGNINVKKIYLKGGNGIYSQYNNNYILNDHNNGHVTLSAAGGNLYIGSQNTGKVLLRKGLYDSSATYRILHESGYIYQSRSGVNNYFAGNIGIGTPTPSGKLVINNSSSAGTPGLIVNNTYATFDSKDIEDQRPFVLRRNTSDSESLSTYVHDTRARFVYKNDEYASGIEFRLINTDKENSDGSRSSDRTVMTISSGQNYGQVQVDGKLLAEEIKVELIAAKDVQMDGTLAANNITVKTNGNTADFVFEENYNLQTLAEVESFIQENKHLPDIPSAAAMEEEGVNLAEMNKLLLQKVEELTLYIIEQEKRLANMEGVIMKLTQIDDE